MRTLHLISHTHWDREWYLPFQQFRLRLVRLMDRLLGLLAADPAFRFYMLDGQTVVLDDYLAVRPEREKELRAHVQAGRLLIGPWHILPDEFLVSPEATVRNLLQGKRTAARFGPRMEVGYLPDPFGHIGQMPQLLRGFGIETAALRRGLADEPGELQWQSPDGSAVFLAYLRDGYDNAAPYPLSSPEDVAPFLAAVRKLRDSLLPHTAAGHILLMHGTDHMEAQPLTSAALAQAGETLDGDRLVHSTLPAYIAAVQEDLRGAEVPTVFGELRSPKRHHLLPGVLSTRMWIKQRNHAGETLLERWAEPFGVWASRGSGEGPSPGVLRHAWRLLLECHPHDSICGCSVDPVHDEMRVRFDQVEQIGETLVRQSLGAIAAAVETRWPSPPPPCTGDAAGRERGPGAPWPRAVVVFNPLGHARTDVVSLLLEVPPGAAAVEVVDEAGRPLPGETVELREPEIDHRLLDRTGLLTLLQQARGGRVHGSAIVGLELRREGPALLLKATLSETGAPDPPALALGLAQAQEAAADPTLERVELWVHSRFAAVDFVAPEVPGHGYRTFWARAQDCPHPLPRYAGEGEGAGGGGEGDLANEFLLLDAAPDGTLTLTDRRTGAVFAGLNRFVDGGDSGDEYNYAPPAADTLVTGRPTAVRRWRSGAGQYVQVELELALPAGLSADRRRRSAETVLCKIRTTACLLPGVPRVDITTEVDNHARDHRLRAHFPVPWAAAAADYDGHLQVVRRPTALPAYDATWAEDPRPEAPQRAFCDVSNGTVGLMLANRGLPEVAVLQPLLSPLPPSPLRKAERGGGKGGWGEEGAESEIALTLLRCVGWLSRADFATRRGHAGPATATPGAQEQGRHRFAYALVPHAGDWTAAYPDAYAFNVPLRAVDAPLHAGALPPAASLLEVRPAAFVLSAVKPAEEGAGVIVRGYNITGEPIRATLAPLHRFSRAARVRLDEEAIEPLPIAQDGSVSLDVGKHEIVTVRLE